MRFITSFPPAASWTRRTRRTLLAATLLAATLLAACSAPGPAFNGVTYDPPEPAPALTLPRADGSVFDFKAQRGAAMLVFFGYTNCPDVCPTTLSDWKKVKRALGSDASRVKFVFISVDPDRDTPDVAQRYVSAFDSTFIGLSGDSAQIERAKSLFHVQSFKEDIQSASGYAVSHSSTIFAIDPRNRLRLLYEFGIAPDKVADDLKQLLRNG
jgi:protein SCO1/2